MKRRYLLFLLPVALVSCSRTETAQWPNGQKKFEKHYTGGKLDGLWEAWNAKGQLTFHGMYVKGKKEGEFIEYTDSTMQNITKSYYKNDAIDSEIYLRGGKRSTAFIYSRNSSDSLNKDIVTSWYANGRVQTKMTTVYKIDKAGKRVNSYEMRYGYDSLGNKTFKDINYFSNGRKTSKNQLYYKDSTGNTYTEETVLLNGEEIRDTTFISGSRSDKE